MANFQERLRQIMDEQGIKAADIARGTGISTGAISRYLSDDKKEPIAPYVIKIAMFLNVTSEWLYGATDVRKPFHEPSIVDVYEQLSEAGKQELYNYAKYLLGREGEGEQ